MKKSRKSLETGLDSKMVPRRTQNVELKQYFSLFDAMAMLVFVFEYDYNLLDSLISVIFLRKGR